MTYIELTNGGRVTVDDEDLEMLSGYTWWSDHKGYAISERKGKAVRMHRLIMGCPSGSQVDHINHDKRDNRKSNLRVCSAAQNQHNRLNYKSNLSGLKGVGWHKATQSWRARIQVEGVQIHLGTFKKKEAAYEAYKNAAKRLHGEFACF